MVRVEDGGSSVIERSTWNTVGLVVVLLALPLAVTRFTNDPFQDAKLFLLLAGTSILWVSLTKLDRSVAITAAVFSVVLVITSLTGVDVARSLTISEYPNADGGLLVFLAAACLAVVGASSPLVARRMPLFLVVGGLLVAAIAVVYRVEPSAWNWLVPGRAMAGATLGHPVFAAFFLSTATAAALSRVEDEKPAALTTLAGLTLGAAVLEERSSLILPVVVLIAWALLARPARRIWLASGGVIIAVLGAHVLVISRLLPSSGSSIAQQFVADAAPDARFRAWLAIIDGAMERPIAGWGMGTTFTAYARGVTAAEYERGWSDAHNLVVEVVAGAGLLGAVTLLALLGVLLWRCRRSARVSWAVAASIAMLLFALFEPINVVTTPLLFLVLGVAGGEPDLVITSAWPRRTGTAVLVVATLVTAVIGTAAFAEKWGSRYRDDRALRASFTIQPWRATAMQRYGTRLATRSQTGEVGYAEVRAAIDRVVDAHPWDPTVRWWAASVALEADLREDAAMWLEAQRSLFPAEGPIIDEALLDVADQE